MNTRTLERHEIADVWSIDRTELIQNVYRVKDGALVLEPQTYDVRGWPEGEPEQYQPILLDCFDHGGTFYGTFDGERLVGAAVLESRFIGRDHDQLQLKFLHVSQRDRNAGLGRSLFERAVARARELGARRLYVSATSSENTVRFYLGLGCKLSEEPDPDLFALEPEDIHLDFDIPQPSADEDEPPRLYGELAGWWPLLSAPAEYAEEAAFYQKTLLGACARPAKTLLEIGSGGGSNASYLKARFETVLVDRSAGMLEVSRRLNPECEHIQGDMRTLRLERTFDCVFVHDAIVYMTTEADLRRAIQTAFVHCRPGGAALFAPDHVRENFAPSTDHGGHDDGDRGLRYLEWTWDPDPSDTTYRVEYAYLLRAEDGSVRVEHETHVEGLFARADWIRLLSEVGFEPSVVPLEHSEVEAGTCEVFVARKPEEAAK